MNGLPSAIESERIVLGALLMETDLIPEISDILTSADFSSDRNGYVFDAIVSLYTAKTPVDMVTVGEKLNQFAYVAELADNCITTANVEFHANKVRDTSTRRHGIVSMQKAIAQLQDAKEDLSQILDDAQNNVLKLGSRSKLNTGVMISPLVSTAIDKYRRASTEPDFNFCVSTGIQSIDLAVDGFDIPSFNVIAGRPGQGKTALMMTFALNQAKAGHKPFILSLEMSKETITDRAIAQESGVSTRKILRNMAGADEWSDVINAAESVSKMQIKIDDDGELYLHEIKRRIRKAVRDGYDIVYIDQFSYILNDIKDGQKLLDSRNEICRTLSSFKKEVNIPIIMMVQINRESNKGAKDGDCEPAMHHLKDTSALEENTDMVMLIHRPFEYTQSASDADRAVLKIPKSRTSRTTRVPLRWNGSAAKFEDRK